MEEDKEIRELGGLIENGTVHRPVAPDYLHMFIAWSVRWHLITYFASKFEHKI